MMRQNFLVLRWSTVAVTMLLAMPAAAEIDGLFVSERFFNDFPTTTLMITTSNSVNPGMAEIDERGFDTGPGGFANRHDILLSADGGLTPNVFSISDPFTIKTEVTLDVGSNSPRKEAGIRVNSPVTGDAQFIINSDAGEIVAFGGGAPFFSFGNNGMGNGYTPGSTILMGMSYVPGSPGQVEYFIDRGMGMESSGLLDWANLEGGPVGFNAGMYGQFSPADNNDFATLTFGNITYVPEPASIYLLIGLCAGFIGWTRRR
jgi:hypothetical protein